MTTEYKIKIKQVLTGEVREVFFKDSEQVQDSDEEKNHLRRFIWEDGNWSCDANRHSSFTNDETDLDELFGIPENDWHRCQYGPNETHLYLVKVFGTDDQEIYSEFE